jgi:hypothetical protein
MAVDVSTPVDVARRATDLCHESEEFRLLLLQWLHLAVLEVAIRIPESDCPYATARREYDRHRVERFRASPELEDPYFQWTTPPAVAASLGPVENDSVLSNPGNDRLGETLPPDRAIGMNKHQTLASPAIQPEELPTQSTTRYFSPQPNEW